ncbi:AraC family transcriptional regulator [Paenibacillus gansuensis]|uniref:Helix-turn-helix domain-containing protein n=1 Tax=Paenibacillus gansuensis TaxID=306542 RepID=A0ABW5PIB5_9BACL
MEPLSLYDESLRSGSYQPKIVAYYYKQWNGFDMLPHTHKAVEIMYVISGRCTIGTDNEVLHMKKGDLILLDSGVRHSLVVETAYPCRMLNVEFLFAERSGGGFSTLADLYRGDAAVAALFQAAPPYVAVRDSNEVYQCLKSLVLELDEKREDGEWMTQLLMHQALVRIARLAREAKAEEKPYDVYIRKCIKYLHQNYDRPLHVKDAAAEVSLHPNYLQRIFRERVGCTIMDYLNGIRMDKAQMLLTHTDLPVNEIPEYIGISSREYFSSLFKKKFGQPPAHFRKSLETFVHPVPSVDL